MFFTIITLQQFEQKTNTNVSALCFTYTHLFFNSWEINFFSCTQVSFTSDNMSLTLKTTSHTQSHSIAHTRTKAEPTQKRMLVTTQILRFVLVYLFVWEKKEMKHKQFLSFLFISCHGSYFRRRFGRAIY